MELRWRYRKWGSCDGCQDDDARLESPELPDLRVVVPPLFCARCRFRFRKLLEELGEANAALKAMTRELPGATSTNRNN